MKQQAIVAMAISILLLSSLIVTISPEVKSSIKIIRNESEENIESESFPEELFEDNENIELDIQNMFKSLDKGDKSEETALIFGYVNDSISGNPIENAHFNLFYKNSSFGYSGNDTYTDSSGYYQFNVPTNLNLIILWTLASGYFYNFTSLKVV